MSTLMDGFFGALLGGLVTAIALTVTIWRENRQRRRDPVAAGMARLRVAANMLNIRLGVVPNERPLIVEAIEELLSAAITMTGYAKVLGKKNDEKLATAVAGLVAAVERWRKTPWNFISPMMQRELLGGPTYRLATIAAMYLADELKKNTYEDIVASADDPKSIITLD